MHKLLGFGPVRALAGAAGICGLALAAGCSYAHGPAPAPCNDPTPATYAAVVSPIFDAQCRACHGHGVYQTLGGGHDFSTYQAIKNQSTNEFIGCVEHQPGYDPMPRAAPSSRTATSPALRPG